MNIKRSIITFVVMLLLSPALGLSAESNFEASVDRAAIVVGETAQLGLTFYNTQSMPAPDVGAIEGLEIRYIGPSTMMTVINGKTSSSITHMYSVTSQRIGKYQLGPFTCKYNSVDYKSNIVFLEVVGEKARAQSTPTQTTTEKLNLEDRIFVTLTLSKLTAYVNELIPVTVKFYVNRLNVRNIQLPLFTQEGFSKAEFREPKQYREELGGLVYDVLEFNTNIFAIRPGDYKIGPAKVRCQVLVPKRTRRSISEGMDEFYDDPRYGDEYFDNFFTRYENHPVELQTQTASLIVSPLPSEGKPSDFSGTVGDFQFIFNAGPKKIKAGDPVTLTMQINGNGNFNTVLSPRLSNIDGFKIYEPQVKTESYSKTFTQVVIPENEKITSTPTASFSYFDPAEKKYKTIVQGPVKIEVEKPSESAPAQVLGFTPPESAKVGSDDARDIVYIKENLGRTYKRGQSLLLPHVLVVSFGSPLLLLILAMVFARSRRTVGKETKSSRRTAAMKIAKRGVVELKRFAHTKDTGEFYEGMFQLLQNYFGCKLGIPSAGITYDAVRNYIEKSGSVNGDLDTLKDLFDECDRARFARIDQDSAKALVALARLKGMLNHFDRIQI